MLFKRSFKNITKSNPELQKTNMELILLPYFPHIYIVSSEKLYIYIIQIYIYIYIYMKK